MAGAHSVEAQRDGLLQQGRELDPLVAPHARIGRPACGVFVDEILNDIFLEPLGKVPDVVRDSEDVAGTPGVTGVLDRAAAAAAGPQGAGHPGQREVDPDDVVPRLDGAGGGNGGINAAAHGCKNSHTGFL
jgi:hypothetical protein